MAIFGNNAQDVEVTAQFLPNNPLGLVVNGEQNKLLLHFANNGKENFTITNAAASYHDPSKHWALLRNASALRYNVPLPAGANFSVPFQVYSEFRPQDVGLTVWANLEDSGKETRRYVAMNSTVTVVEPPQGWFDIQLIFMYLIVAAALSAIGYFAYQQIMARYFPKHTRTGTRKARKTVVPAETATKGYPESVKPYEEEWIPEHLRKREPKARKGRVAGDVTSDGGEATSGGETSGPEKKKGKGKGKAKRA